MRTTAASSLPEAPRKGGRGLLGFLLASFILGHAPALAEEVRRPALPEYRIEVSFDPAAHLVRGTASLFVPGPGSAAVSCGSLRIISLSADGEPFEYELKNNSFRVAGGRTVVIRYEGVFPGGRDRQPDPGMVSEKGIFLTGAWYPAVEGLAWYSLTAIVPPGFEAVSEADEITARETPAGRETSFVFSHPLPSVDLVAGRYQVAKDSVEGIALYAYFFPEDAALAGTYLDHAKKYFQLYNKLLVPYPYKRFSIVENVLPTGLSLPTFTLLGQEVLRLPFIPATSLGHEIVHQWFGNSVYADFSKGNWLEAVTSYLSDHLYKEQEGKGWEYRKNILIDYQSYVTPANDFPLRKFQERTDGASMAIGYGKGAMLFHMLRNLVGDRAFFGSLRRLVTNSAFRRASWEDVERSFERGSGKELSWFFTQWLDRTGVPVFLVRHAAARELNGVPSASLELAQQNKPYRIALPASVAAARTVREELLSMQTGTRFFRIDVPEPASGLVLDREYDVMRALSPDEFPPVLARLLGGVKKLALYPKQEREKYATLISVLQERGFTVREEAAVRDRDLRSSSLLIAGAESPVWKRLFGAAPRHGPGFSLTVRENPLNEAQVVASVQADSRDEVDLAAPRIVHYGTYSTLRFERGANREKQTAPSDRGMVFDLSLFVSGAAPDRALRLDEIVDAVGSGDDVVLIGERHTNYEDHKEELAVIRGLFEKGKKIAVGMEMFQRPFQGAVNAYLAGKIGEREFLKQTEYFKRWVFDYNLYREIVEFCRANKIPLVALNQRTEITDKVAAGGLEALSPEEMKEVPPDMDMANESYKARLREIFEDHPGGPTFENFYQAQILWDETMAHSAARFLRANPGRQLVVLAGVEHVMYGAGIPSRIERLTGRTYVTLVNGSLDRGIGTYALFPQPLDPPFTPRLGVALKESAGLVQVAEFPAGSPAQRAGIEEGDVIRSVSGWNTRSISDVRIALFDKTPGEAVSVVVQRKRLFLGTRELAFTVIL